jgi:D-3-phosphoglycerate dehydrogenase / 2-oxoglutarate reductase
LARNLPNANETTRRGEWLRFNGIGLRGKVIGLIGLGAVGREAAVRLRNFDCRILTTDPMVTKEQASKYGVELVSLDQLITQSDFISLHAPVLPSTTNMVNQEFLKKTKKGAYLINTARGELIDEAALLDAIQSGQLRGAALDCFRKEPPAADHPLLKLQQVIVTPHSGSHTDDATHQMGWMSLEECLAVLRNERPKYVINPQVYEKNSMK